MSNIENTVPATVAAAPVVPFLNVDTKPEGEVKVKAMPYGAFAMREIVKGLRATEKGNRSNVIHHTGQVIETIARIMRDDAAKGTDSFKADTRNSDKPVPPGVDTALKNTLREVIVAMIKAGDAPYLNCEVSVARIKAMPKGTEQQRNLWDYQARKLADSTLFLNGQAVEKPKGKYLPESLKDAKAKEFVESLKVLRNYTNKVVAFIWNEHSDVIREFAFRTPDGEQFRDLDAADVESIAALIETKAPGGMSALAQAFRKPDAKPDTRTPVEKLLESFAKLNLEDRVAFLKLANNKHADLIAAAKAAEESVNKDGGEGKNPTDIFADLRDEAAA